MEILILQNARLRKRTAVNGANRTPSSGDLPFSDFPGPVSPINHKSPLGHEFHGRTKRIANDSFDDRNARTDTAREMVRKKFYTEFSTRCLPFIRGSSLFRSSTIVIFNYFNFASCEGVYDANYNFKKKKKISSHRFLLNRE